MKFFDLVERVILAQLKKSCLVNFKELSLTISPVQRRRVNEHEGIYYYVEKSECIRLKVGHERKSNHLQERFVFWLNLSMEKAASKWSRLGVYFCMKLIHPIT